MFRGKKYKQAFGKIEKEKEYSIEEAVKIIKENKMEQQKLLAQVPGI